LGKADATDDLRVRSVQNRDYGRVCGGHDTGDKVTERVFERRRSDNASGRGSNHTPYRELQPVLGYKLLLAVNAAAFYVGTPGGGEKAVNTA